MAEAYLPMPAGRAIVRIAAANPIRGKEVKEKPIGPVAVSVLLANEITGVRHIDDSCLRTGHRLRRKLQPFRA
jgi:hypothetical protein